MSDSQRGAALVTGAARGIGRAIAVALSHAGFNIIVNDLPGASGLAETVEAIEAHGGRANAVEADISKIENHTAFIDRSWTAFGSLECLVNNAGVSVLERQDILKVTPESYDRLMNINLRGPFFLTQAVSKRMIAETSSRFRSVITISSINVDHVSIDRAEYCISKNGLAMMSKLFAVRLADAGINTYEIRPGIIRTQMTAVAKEKYDGLFANGLAPIARWGEAEDVGNAVSMLASGSLAYSTGETIHVDGGLSVRKL